MRGRLRSLGVGLGWLVDPGTWVVAERLLACAYPRRAEALDGLARQGVRMVVNLHERPHDPARLAALGLREVHLPVRDFTPPSPDQLAAGVAAIRDAVAAGDKVAVHCGAGLGRTGTLLACYLVSEGWDADAAIREVRARRPGSIETAGQVAAVHAYAG